MNKSSSIERIKKLQSSVRDQSKSLNLNEHEPRIKQLIINLINKYGDIKTILNLQELLSPSNATRSKSIPRPQNPWVLYRKNISKGLIGLNMSTGEISGISSNFWNEIPERESQFWTDITKEIHSIEYPNYKYSPVRSHNQNKSSKEVISQNTNLDTSVSKDSSEIVSHTTSEIDISPEIDIDMSEVDIDMVAADLFQSDFLDVDMNPSLFILYRSILDRFIVYRSILNRSIINRPILLFYRPFFDGLFLRIYSR
ncbi:unnamed protein product [Rhizophagus irregularis]|nr:unnamed protein product [Rhizophagus irregularis]